MNLQDTSLNATTAIAILVDTPHGARFFCAFGKSGCVQTAWSLAGAKLFIASCEDKLNQVTERLTKKNKKYTLQTVTLSLSPFSMEVIE